MSERVDVAANLCPSCGVKGQRVELQTVQAMLKVSLNRISGENYRFCRSSGCAVVYYSSDGQSIFEENEVREKVYHKHTDEDTTPICYCFGYSVGQLRSAIQHAVEDQILDDIEGGVQSGNCACEIRNTQGACCLGSVRAAVKRWTE